MDIITAFSALTFPFSGSVTPTCISNHKVLHVRLDAPWRNYDAFNSYAWSCPSCKQNIPSGFIQPTSCPYCDTQFSGSTETSETERQSDRERRYAAEVIIETERLRRLWS